MEEKCNIVTDCGIHFTENMYLGRFVTDLTFKENTNLGSFVTDLTFKENTNFGSKSN